MDRQSVWKYYLKHNTNSKLKTFAVQIIIYSNFINILCTNLYNSSVNTLFSEKKNQKTRCNSKRRRIVYIIQPRCQCLHDRLEIISVDI